MKKLVLAGLLTLGFAVPAFSQMQGASMHGHGEGHGEMLEMGHMDGTGDMTGMCLEHADKIGLTDDQLAKMKPLHRAMQKQQARFKADLKIAEIELMEIMDVKDFDLEKAVAAAKKVSDIKTAHQLDKLKAMKEIRTELTDEQYKKMKKIMPMHKAERKPSKRSKKK